MIRSELPAEALAVLRVVNVGKALRAEPLDPSAGPAGFTIAPSMMYSFPIGVGPPRPALFVKKASPEFPQRTKFAGTPTTPGITMEPSNRNSFWSYDRINHSRLLFKSNIEVRRKTRPRVGSTTVKVGVTRPLRVVGA